MHVLHIMEATIGGTRRHLVDVAREQLRRGLRVSLVVATLREERFLADLERLRTEGCGVYELAMTRELAPLADLRHLRSLSRLLGDLRPDVVHTHSSKAGVLGRLASAQTGVGARVHTPHTMAFLFQAEFGTLKRRLFGELERALALDTGRLIAVSESEAETYRACGVVSQAHLRVVENGIDPVPWQQARPLPRAGLELPADVPVAVVAGLHHVAKGHDIALRALAEPGLEDLHLLLMGRGELRAELERLATDLSVDARVRFLGWREDVPALFATSDFLWLPSRWEGMPYVVLEAMASGLPVVAAAVDGAREVVLEGRTGFLAPIEDPPGLALATRRLLALDPAARRALGAAGRARVLARHTVAGMVDGLLQVYAEIL